MKHGPCIPYRLTFDMMYTLVDLLIQPLLNRQCAIGKIIRR